MQSSDADGVAQRPRVRHDHQHRAPVAGADVAQLYLGDPAAAGEPPRQLVGFSEVKLQPGQSARVAVHDHAAGHLVVGRRRGGWTQTAGDYHVYVGDSSALANLPLRGSFPITQTPRARQVIVDAPSTMTPGQRRASP